MESNSDERIIGDPKQRILKVDSVSKHAKHWLGVDILVFNTYVWWMSGLRIKSLWVLKLFFFLRNRNLLYWLNKFWVFIHHYFFLELFKIISDFRVKNADGDHFQMERKGMKSWMHQLLTELVWRPGPIGLTPLLIPTRPVSSSLPCPLLTQGLPLSLSL